MFGTPSQTSSLFGTPQAHSTPASGGLFGGAQNSAGAGLFGQKRPTALLGSAATTSTPSFAFNKTSAPSLFTSSTTTSSAPSLFGSTATAAPAFSSFSKPATTSFFGNTSATVAPNVSSLEQRNLQHILQSTNATVRAVSAPERYGDERDKVLARLNQMLAANGVGNGYYDPNAAPIPFDDKNPFYRLKSVGYNRMSEHTDADGVCSLILKVPHSQLETPQQKQKVLDALFAILGNKPTIHAHIEDLQQHGADRVDLAIYVTEKERGRITATELYKYLTQDDKRRMLEQQLLCERVVPRLGIPREELKNYMKNPPLGYDTTSWAQAVKDNPDPERLIPHPVRGFEELIARQRMQTTQLAHQRHLLDDMAQRLDSVHSQVLAADARRAVCKQRQKQISHRLLRVLATQTLIQRFGMPISEDEENLETQLERLNALLNAPGQIKQRLTEAREVLVENSDFFKEKFAAQAAEELRVDDVKEVKRVLVSNQTQLEGLVELVEANKKDLTVCESL